MIHRMPPDTTMKKLLAAIALPVAALSQSEHDWAYAKRALARGDEPEEIIRRIADFRAEDKPSPEYYARHTVMNAQADLQRKAASTEVAFTELTPGNESHSGPERNAMSHQTFVEPRGESSLSSKNAL